MNYDNWKATNPADEFLGPPPMVVVTCPSCFGDGSIDEPCPFPDDPYYCRALKCEECNGAGVVEEPTP